MKKTKVKPVLQAQPADSDFELTVSTGPAWVVYYQGQTIQIRKDHLYKDLKKYLPTTSTQAGTAKRLAAKLNAMFNTSDFEARPIKP